MISRNAADDIWSTRWWKRTYSIWVALYPSTPVRDYSRPIGLVPGMAVQKFDPGEVCNVIQSIVQTLLCGMFIHLLSLALYVFVKRGFDKRSSIVIFAATIIAYCISMGGLLASGAALITQFIAPSFVPSPRLIDIINYRDSLKAIAHVNLLFADGVVIWRMYVLCSSDFSKLVLSIPTVLSAIASVSAGAIVGFRIYSTRFPNGTDHRQLFEKMIDVTQMTCRVCSLIANLIATSIIARWVWRYRRNVQQVVRLGSSTRRLERVLILLLESGAIFCASSTFLLLSSLIKIPLVCTLGDIYIHVHTSLAGMYPALVMVLVYSQANSSLEGVSRGTLIFTSPVQEDEGTNSSTVVFQRPSHSALSHRSSNCGVSQDARSRNHAAKQNFSGTEEAPVS